MRHLPDELSDLLLCLVVVTVITENKEITFWIIGNTTILDLKFLFCFDAFSNVRDFFIILPVNGRACQSSRKKEQKKTLIEFHEDSQPIHIRAICQGISLYKLSFCVSVHSYQYG